MSELAPVTVSQAHALACLALKYLRRGRLAKAREHIRELKGTLMPDEAAAPNGEGTK